MRDRRTWASLGKEEKALRLQQVANAITAMPITPTTPKGWREVAYALSVPENVVRAHFDPTQKDYYAKAAIREKNRYKAKIPGKP